MVSFHNFHEFLKVFTSDKLFKYLGKLKGWDKEAFDEALSNADKDEEILVWG